MEKVKEMREVWRQKRFQKWAARLQSKQKGQSKPFSDKVLGIKSNNSKMSTETHKSNGTELKLNASKPPLNMRKLPRSTSEPKIIPRETKLSMQRKSMLDPQYKLKKLLENKSMISSQSYLNNNFAVGPIPGQPKIGKVTPKITSHSCTNLLNVPQNTDINLPGFSPLVKGLDSWLKKRGKRFTSFKNLKTMATKEPEPLLILECDEKENFLPSCSSTNSSASTISEGNHGVIILQKTGEIKDLKRMLEGSLEDLSTIIRMGYPVKECEVWLMAMHSHYPDLSKYPLYWECKAAINSRMGIKQELPSTDLDKVNTQVTDLVNKLKVLNLSPPKKQTETSQNKRVLLDINVNNVLHSSSIQFSVKKNEEIEAGNFVVTPVRRSARKHKCMIHNTSQHVKCVKSLLDLSPEVRDKMQFEPNMALLNN